MSASTSGSDEARLREQRRRTFDTAADRYAAHRPGYPEAVFDAVLAFGGLQSGARVLEIGCGPGQATLPLARRGLLVHAVELGASLAEVARRAVAADPRISPGAVEIEVAAFEEVEVPRGRYALALSASAFHWLDRPRAYPQLHQALAAAGTLALLWTVHDPAGEDPEVWARLQEVYRVHAPGLFSPEAARRHPGRAIDAIPAELEATGQFTRPDETRYRWSTRYDAAGYLALLGTYSDHLALEPAVWARLAPAIAEVISARPGGVYERPSVTRLMLSRRL